MDYFDYLDYERHVDWDAFTQKYPSDHYYLLSRFAKQNFYDMNFNHPDEDLFLVFEVKVTVCQMKSKSL